MRSLIVALLLTALGCTDRTPLQLRIVASVHDDGGRPLAHVAVRVGEQTLARTDAQGRAVLTQAVSRGARITLSVSCPPGFSSPAARPLRAGAAGQLSLEFACRPELRSVALVVHAPEAVGLPVFVDGELIGEVAADGTLHAKLMRAAQSELRATIDTSAAPKLTPPHPARAFVVPDRDEILLFAPELAERVKRLKRPSRTLAQRALQPVLEAHLPYAIGRR